MEDPEGRTLFYDPYMGDWQLSIGGEPKTVSARHILLVLTQPITLFYILPQAQVPSSQHSPPPPPSSAYNTILHPILLSSHLSTQKIITKIER